MVAIAAVCWSVFADMKDGQMARVLRDIARRVSLRRYRKTPHGSKKSPPRRRYQHDEHVAISQLIGERKKRRP
jgi:hypothetical protein